MRTPLLAAVVAVILGTTCGVMIHVQRKPYGLEQTMNCMLKALMNSPGVSDPVFSYDTGRGESGPTLRFETADHASWTGSPKCGLNTRDIGHFCFHTFFVASPTRDLNLESNVIARLKQQCGVTAEITSSKVD